MKTYRLAEGVYYLGMRDWDRRLFDELIPLPQGTSYNAYLVQGEKTALIDTVDPRMGERFIRLLREIGVKRIDYIISNHSEQDHSGVIPDVLEAYPEAEVVATPKGRRLLMDLLHIPEDKIMEVDEGDTLSLGGKTLEFIHAPWIHWPETMLTYLREQHILFTCDLFGSHLAQSNPYAVDENLVYEAAKRYYAEIMMPFRKLIKRYLERLEGLEIEVIAPSHGPIYHRPQFILEAYRDWTSDAVKNQVVIIYVSMHGSIEEMVNHLLDALMREGVEVKPFNLTAMDIGELAISLVDAATLIVATPTFLGGPHPMVQYAATLIGALRPKLRFIALLASYGWGGRALETLKETLKGVGAEFIDTVSIRGRARDEDLRRIEELAEKTLMKHREFKLMEVD